MRLSILGAAVLACAIAVSGCQTQPVTNSLINNTYAGKEQLPAWIRYHHELDASNGHELRGYRDVRRHWFH